MTGEEYVVSKSFVHPKSSDGLQLVTLKDGLEGVTMVRDECKVKIGKLERLLRVILKNRGFI